MADTLIQGTTIIEDKRSNVIGTVISISAQAFVTNNETLSFARGIDGESRINMNDASPGDLAANAQIPHGVTVTKVIAYGSDSTNVWKLKRTDLVTGQTQTTMATTTVNSEDTSIVNAVIDNNTYQYFVEITGMEQNDLIHGAVITFT